MKECSVCRNQYLDKLLKCPRCGNSDVRFKSEFQLPCPHCGESNTKFSKTCFSCGKTMDMKPKF